MRTSLAPLLVLALAAAPAYADGDEPASKSEGPRAVDKGTLGVGLMIGEPVGVCARLYVQDDQAIQGALGAAFIGGGDQRGEIKVDQIVEAPVGELTRLAVASEIGHVYVVAGVGRRLRERTEIAAVGHHRVQAQQRATTGRGGARPRHVQRDRIRSSSGHRRRR